MLTSRILGFRPTTRVFFNMLTTGAAAPLVVFLAPAVIMAAPFHKKAPLEVIPSFSLLGVGQSFKTLFPKLWVAKLWQVGRQIPSDF